MRGVLQELPGTDRRFCLTIVDEAHRLLPPAAMCTLRRQWIREKPPSGAHGSRLMWAGMSLMSRETVSRQSVARVLFDHSEHPRQTDRSPFFRCRFPVAGRRKLKSTSATSGRKNPCAPSEHNRLMLNHSSEAIAHVAGFKTVRVCVHKSQLAVNQRIGERKRTRIFWRSAGNSHENHHLL